MTINMVTMLAFASAAAGIGAAWHMWRRATANYTLLVESAGSFDALRRECERLRESARGQFDEMKRLRDAATIARGDADAARRAQAEAMERVRTLEGQERQSRERLATERQHFVSQLESAHKEIARLHAASAEARQFAESGLAAELQSSRERSSSLTQKVERQEADLRAARSELSEKLDLMHKIKRRNAHLERLYNTMRGLKLMAEERNANWENALKDLSVWALSQKFPGRSGAEKMPIGELVGGALESIGKSLTEVDFEVHHEP